MEKISETKVVLKNGITLNTATIGQGPAILFIHGFPELWYSWRHQLVALAGLGYRAIAPDLRGYGGSSSPPDSSSYATVLIVGDLVGLVDALGLDQVFVVGHDWGAIIAWHFCLLRPDRVKAMVNTSVANMLRDQSVSPVAAFRAAYTDDFYISRFQEPGKVEGELSRVSDPANITRGFFQLFGVPETPVLPKNVGLDELFNVPIPKPSWLTDEDVDYYAKRFSHAGFTGPLNYYRAIDRTGALMAAFEGLKIEVPVRFVVGERDLTYNMIGVKEYIHGGGLKKDVPHLEEPVIVMEGVGHFLNQEKPDEVNALIYEFFGKFRDQPSA